MKYICFRWVSRDLGGHAVRIYPLSCWHIGAAQCDLRFIRDHIARIAEDPAARWVYLGDGGECVTRLSKGDLFGQVLPADDQQNLLVELLAPIAKKGLFGVVGNHGARVYKATGLDFDHTLCARLGIPYLGISAMANFVVNRSSYDAYFHHGIDSGTSLRAKVARAEEFSRFIAADALFTAHSHVAMALQPAALLGADNANRRIRTILRHPYICGSAYDSRTGYAEARGYPPLLPSHLVVEFDGTIIRGRAQYRQTHTIFRSSGDYPLPPYPEGAHGVPVV